LSSSTPSLADFGNYLGSRREAILDTWREASLSDPVLTSGDSLTRDQFRDHIPQVLEALQRKLRSVPGEAQETQADVEIRQEEAKHGLQRWQQGFRLEELTREWGLLHLCLASELEEYAMSRKQWAPRDLWAAGRELILLVNEGVSESIARYAALERAAAAGRANDLSQAVAQLEALERRRAELIHQAVHDLRGNAQSVTTIAQVLGGENVPESERMEFAKLLQNSVEVLGSMVTELMELARLEAGQERRNIAPFDATELATDLCKLNAHRAASQRLFLRHSGPARLPVEGDASKVRRLVQNLLQNALKYTEKGGVTVSWGTEPGHWWVIVQDTGPGLLSGPGTPLAKGIRDATVVAREADEQAADSAGRVSHVLNQADAGTASPLPGRQKTGEGIGLSIVKRLCELLDASLELTSSSASGTTVRVLFPLAYPVAPATPAANT
jgi:signal transduction histidine kinase